MAYERTDALIAEFAAATGTPPPAPQAEGGYDIEVREGIRVVVFGLDEDTVLLMTSLGPLPDEPTPTLVTYLLRKNMFDSDISPFQIGLQETGDLVLWGSVPIDTLSGERLAEIFDAIGDQAARLVEVVAGSRTA